MSIFKLVCLFLLKISTSTQAKLSLDKISLVKRQYTQHADQNTFSEKRLDQVHKIIEQLHVCFTFISCQKICK